MALVATLIGDPRGNALAPELVNSAASELSAHAPDWLSDGNACDLLVRDNISASEAEALLASVTEDKAVDFAVQETASRKKKALIADMDSTMIEQECIDELAAEAGVKDQVSEITARAMNGEINFEGALRERLQLLKGLPESTIETVLRERITYAPGGKVLLATMKGNGAFTALVSGGFTAFTEAVARELGFDCDRANRLEVENGKLTGQAVPPILGADAKVAALRQLAAEQGLTPADFIAVGDGANDLPMLKLAGTGVALHAKPAVAAQSKIRVNHGDLTALLYLQGYRDSEFVR